ncbi:MAG: aspartate 1-decarboxylase [Chitinispirillaceae bacterium]|nr:aspartate 1-decarboxylase [Chitinispirillaceae bacterium]
MLKSKIHRMSFTGVKLDNKSSIPINKQLTGQVHTVNINKSTRLIACSIPAKNGSGKIAFNDATFNWV